jgi:hypothetical protein
VVWIKCQYQPLPGSSRDVHQLPSASLK